MHVLDEQRRHLAVGQRAVAVVGVAPPRAEVHLVDRDRARASDRRPARVGHPRVVVPRVGRASQTTDAVSGGASVATRERIGLVDTGSRCAVRDAVLVAAPAPTPGTNASQMPASTAGASGWRSASQPLKSPIDGDVAGVRRPHREPGARRAVDVARCAPSMSYSATVRALVEQVQVDARRDAGDVVADVRRRWLARSRPCSSSSSKPRERDIATQSGRLRSS